MKTPWSKEWRRATQLLDLVTRRTPLSHAQRQRLARARETLASIRRESTKEARRKAFVAVAEIADILLEVLPESQHSGSETEG